MTVTLIPVRLPDGEIINIHPEKFDDFLHKNVGKILRTFRDPWDNRLGVSVYDVPVKITAILDGSFFGLFEANRLPERGDIIKSKSAFCFVDVVSGQDTDGTFVVNLREPNNRLSDRLRVKSAKGETLGSIDDSNWRCHQID